MEAPKKSLSTDIDYTYKILVILALTITATILARDIVIPLAFAALLSVVMLPVIKRLEQKRVPTALAITLVFTTTVAVIGLLGWLMVDQVMRLMNDLPNLQDRVDDFLQNMSQTLSNNLYISRTNQNEMIANIVSTISNYFGDFLVTTSSTISILVQIPIYVFLFLLYRRQIEAFFLSMVTGSGKLAWRSDIEKVVQGYISGLALVTGIIIVLNTLGLWMLGIDHAIFFGVLSGVLTVIPYVGIIIGSIFPIIMALITKDSIWYAFGVIGVFGVVQFLEGNFITPRITGSRVSINALAAIVALLVGGKILGVAGMILAVPLVGIAKIFLSRSERFNHFAILLEDVKDAEETMAQVKASEAPAGKPPANDVSND